MLKGVLQLPVTLTMYLKNMYNEYWAGVQTYCAVVLSEKIHYTDLAL